MQIVLTIIAVLVIFSILVLVHEFGHFWAAKKSGVKVLEFGIGFPPRLFAKKYGETVYSVNAVPFGGFVRLYGEDSTEKEALKSRRSFAGQKPWTRIKIIVAGVLMNFLLAYVLLTVGFTFGIQPLILNEQDLFENLSAGNVDIATGAFVKEVKEESIASSAGILAGDEIKAIDGKPLMVSEEVTQLESGVFEKDIDVTVLRNGQPLAVHLALPEEGENFGLSFHTSIMFPRPKLAGVKSDSVESKAGFRKGDVFLKVNGDDVYSAEEVVSKLSSASDFNVVFVRDGSVQSISYAYPRTSSVVIEEVLLESAAQKAGFKDGDFIDSINGVIVKSPEEVQKIIQGSGQKSLTYDIVRGSQTLKISASTDEKNMLGIVLANVFKPKGGAYAFSQGALLTSLTKVHDVRYPFFTAAKKSWDEMWRLSSLTVTSFGSMVKKLVTTGTVPEDIGGPVRIAYFTHIFVQEGFFALLRFTALLSISLAVLNIIPIPALDGGRFLFVLIEMIFRKKVNARFEALVHRVGFIVLLALLVLVTYSDFAKIF